MDRSLEMHPAFPAPVSGYVDVSVSPAMIATPQRTEEPPRATGTATLSSLATGFRLSVFRPGCGAITRFGRMCLRGDRCGSLLLEL
jgi:hypothetical protein